MVVTYSVFMCVRVGGVWCAFMKLCVHMVGPTYKIIHSAPLSLTNDSYLLLPPATLHFSPKYVSMVTA